MEIVRPRLSASLRGSPICRADFRHPCEEVLASELGSRALGRVDDHLACSNFTSWSNEDLSVERVRVLTRPFGEGQFADVESQGNEVVRSVASESRRIHDSHRDVSKLATEGYCPERTVIRIHPRASFGNPLGIKCCGTPRCGITGQIENTP